MSYYLSPARHFARRMAEFENARSSVHIPVNVSLVEDVYHLEAYVPGVDAKDVKIEVLDNILTISGDFPVLEVENTAYLLQEIPSGSFSRSLRMPTEMDASKAEAEVVNGVLNLRVPKAELAKAQQIKVKAK